MVKNGNNNTPNFVTAADMTEAASMTLKASVGLNLISLKQAYSMTT